jgi:hypothetical protein
MSNARAFASELLAELRQRDPRAAALKTRTRGPTAVIGIEDQGEFVPVFRLDRGSAKFNVMSLSVLHRRRWAPTFERATPRDLAVALAGPLNHLWTIPLSMVDFSADVLPP